MKTNVVVAGFLAAGCGFSLSTLAASAQDNGSATGAAQLLINATPKVVWQAVQDERQHDPTLAYSRVLSSSGNQETIEQKFIGIPILGSATAVTRQNKTPFSHIDYSLISSDKFKSLNGSWDLTPVNGGKATILRLSSDLDIGVPFSRMFIRNATQRKLRDRLINVKTLAERQQAQLAASGRSDL